MAFQLCSFELEFRNPHLATRTPNLSQPATRNAQLVSSIQHPASSILHPVSRLAAGGCFFAFNPGLDDVGCATDARRYSDGIGRTIQGTGPTPHSMHPSRSRIAAFLPSNRKTPWGQTFSHMPQPTHTSVLSANVVTPDKYLKSSIFFSVPLWLFYPVSAGRVLAGKCR